MEPGYELGIIWDETAESVRQVLTEAANKAQVRIRDIKVSLEEQRTYGLVPDRELSLEIRDVLQDSQCILNCVSGHTEGGRFRQKLISGGADRGKRLGHIPGATLELLAYAVNIDYDVVVQRCQDLAAARFV